jgi:exopolysaccharide biosynthesis protein
LVYFAADIYVTDLKCFISPFSDGEYNKGSRKFVYDIAREYDAIIAVNGDYYSENAGPVLRDGVLYRNEVKCDILVLFKDGVMRTYSSEEYDKNSIEAMKEDVWQIWTFGPMLLEDGQPKLEFNLSKQVGGINPRTAIGYYEPGHYVFVTVDGRQPGYSDGLDMAGLSRLMYDLGCSVAFNVDGGGTAQMAFMGNEINEPSVHRKTRDALCIIDYPYPEKLY